MVTDEKKGIDLLNSCQTLSDITKAITEERITSVFTVVEMLLCYVFTRNTPNREDTAMFITTIENLCSDKQLQKVSVQFLDINISALQYSSLRQSDQMISVLNEIKNNKNLSTRHENVIVRHDKRITITKYTEYKHLFTFNYLTAGTCTCLLYTSPSPRDQRGSRMPSSA